jgi:hypothetical protein
MPTVKEPPDGSSISGSLDPRYESIKGLDGLSSQDQVWEQSRTVGVQNRLCSDMML